MERSEELADRLYRETGVDFRSYQKPELGKNLSDLLSAFWILRVGLGAVVVTEAVALISAMIIIGPIAHELVGDRWGEVAMVPVAAYFIGASLFGAAGLALLLFARKLSQSLGDILNVTFGIVRNAAHTIVDPDGAEGPLRRIRLTELVKGALFVSVLPIVSGVVKGKLPLVGRGLVWALERAIVGPLIDVAERVESLISGPNEPAPLALEAGDADANVPEFAAVEGSELESTGEPRAPGQRPDTGAVGETSDPGAAEAGAASRVLARAADLVRQVGQLSDRATGITDVIQTGFLLPFRVMVVILNALVVIPLLLGILYRAF